MTFNFNFNFLEFFVNLLPTTSHTANHACICKGLTTTAEKIPLFIAKKFLARLLIIVEWKYNTNLKNTMLMRSKFILEELCC